MKRIRLSHDLFHDFSVMRRDSRPPVLVRIASAGNELLRCHIFRDLMKLRQESNDAREFIRFVGTQGFTRDFHASFIRLEISRHCFQKCRFPTAIPSKEGDDAALSDEAARAFQYLMIAEGHMNVRNSNCNITHHALLLNRYRKNGAPRKAMMMPAGISIGEKRTRPSVSQKTSTPAPRIAEPGTTYL